MPISRIYSVDVGNGIVPYKGFDNNFHDAEIICIANYHDFVEMFGVDDGQIPRESVMQYLKDFSDSLGRGFPDVTFYRREGTT